MNIIFRTLNLPKPLDQLAILLRRAHSVFFSCHYIPSPCLIKPYMARKATVISSYPQCFELLNLEDHSAAFGLHLLHEQ